MHDRAFARGFLTFDEDHRAVVSNTLKTDNPPPFHTTSLLAIEGTRLRLPDRLQPDGEALEYHRSHVFRDGVADEEAQVHRL